MSAQALWNFEHDSSFYTTPTESLPRYQSKDTQQSLVKTPINTSKPSSPTTPHPRDPYDPSPTYSFDYVPIPPSFGFEHRSLDSPQVYHYRSENEFFGIINDRYSPTRDRGPLFPALKEIREGEKRAEVKIKTPLATKESGIRDKEKDEKIKGLKLVTRQSGLVFRRTVRVCKAAIPGIIGDALVKEVEKGKELIMDIGWEMVEAGYKLFGQRQK